MRPVTVAYNGYLITTDKNLLSPEAAYNWLSKESYWAKNIPYEVVKHSFDNSFCIGILKDSQQVGFARMITDYATLPTWPMYMWKTRIAGKGWVRK